MSDAEHPTSNGLLGKCIVEVKLISPACLQCRHSDFLPNGIRSLGVYADEVATTRRARCIVRTAQAAIPSQCSPGLRCCLRV